jgi:hypothetical protein
MRGKRAAWGEVEKFKAMWVWLHSRRKVRGRAHRGNDPERNESHAAPRHSGPALRFDESAKPPDRLAAFCESAPGKVDMRIDH